MSGRRPRDRWRAGARAVAGPIRGHLAAAALASAALLGPGAAPALAQANDGRGNAGQSAAVAAVEVVVAPFADVAVHPQREAPATVVPRNESRIAAEVGATLVEILVDVGQTAPRGAVLARLDDTDLKLAHERAIAQRDAAASRLALSERQLARARELQQGNFLSPEALNQRETEVASLKADLRVLDTQVATARRQLDKAVLRAPFDAAIRSRTAQLGELAVPGAPLFVLTQMGSPEVSARIASEEAQWLPQVREIALEAGGRTRALKLLRVSPVADRETRTREARFAFADPAAGEPAPGSEGRLLWRDPRAHVPPELLVRRGDALGIFVQVGETVRFVPAPRAQEGRPAVVSQPDDARVVVRGQVALQDGQRVRAVAR
jgi:RND family efflux transporter MFP subunit